MTAEAAAKSLKKSSHCCGLKNGLGTDVMGVGVEVGLRWLSWTRRQKERTSPRSWLRLRGRGVRANLAERARIVSSSGVSWRELRLVTPEALGRSRRWEVMELKSVDGSFFIY